MSTLVVTIEDHKPIEVKRFEEGIQTGKRKMLTDDFLVSILELMEDKEIVRFLMKKRYLNIIEEYLENGEDDIVFSDLLSIILKRVKYESEKLESNTIYLELFKQMIERVDITKINSKWLNDILKATMKNVDSINEDMNVFQDLLLLLLEKGNVNENLLIPTLSKILKAAANKVSATENKEELRILLESFVKNVEGEWVEQILLKNAPNRVIYDGFMPKNIVSYSKTLKFERVILEVPKGKHHIKYHNVDIKDVGHPRLLFSFIIKDERISSMGLVAVKDKILTEESQIYRYPYSNVHDSGLVCWSYGQYEIDNLQKLQHIPYIFLSTPNNTHLSDNVREMYTSFSGKDFDENILVPMNKTFKECFE